MLQQILAKLVIKYPGLSKTYLGLLAAEMAKKVTEESGIDTAIAELDNAPIPIATLAAEFQKEGDRRVSEAKKAWEKANPPKKDPPAKTDPDESAEPLNKDEVVPEWAKGLIATVTNLTKEKRTSSMSAIVAEKLKDKVPAKFYAKIPLPEKDEDLDAFIEGIEADYTELFNDGTDKNIAANVQNPKSGQSKKTGGEEKQATADEVKNVVDQIM